MLYTAAELGLSDGDKIRSITIKGYAPQDWTTSLKVAYEWTNDQSMSKPTSGDYDISGMTVAIDEDAHLWAKGRSETEVKDMITLTFRINFNIKFLTNLF